MSAEARVAVVTGGARGIGLAVATALAASGAQVAVGDLDAELATAAAASTGGLGLRLDVRSEDSFAAFLAAVRERYGPIDVLVNNAGVVAAGDFLDTPAADHALQIAVNLAGVDRGMRLALPEMVARGRGHVVNIASAAGRIPAPGAAVYTATKQGVVGLTEAVRGELLGTGVRVTAVLPTVVRTEMASGLPMRGLPVVDPARVAAAVLWVLRHRRPPARVMVPRWLAVAAALDAVSPQWLRDATRRAARLQGVDWSARAGYEARLDRQRETN